MNNKSNAAAVISYLTWIGFIVALVIRDKTDSFTSHHLNQALVINVLGIVGGALNVIPMIGSVASGIVSLAVLVLWCMGVYRAVTWSMDPLPIIGDIHLIG